MKKTQNNDSCNDFADKIMNHINEMVEQLVVKSFDGDAEILWETVNIEYVSENETLKVDLTLQIHKPIEKVVQKIEIDYET